MRRTFVIGLVMAAVALAGCKPTKLSEQYPGAWHDATNVDLISTLARNNNFQCPEFFYRAFYGHEDEYMAEHRGAYLVACYDGDNRTLYEVFPSADPENKGQVVGPEPKPDDIDWPKF